MPGLKIKDKNDIAYCGVDCSACADYLNGFCPSCRKSRWEGNDICMPVKCCLEKKIQFCAFCNQFPCDNMKQFYEETENHKKAYQRMLGMKIEKQK